jgi:hypothetical protein
MNKKAAERLEAMREAEQILLLAETEAKIDHQLTTESKPIPVGNRLDSFHFQSAVKREPITMESERLPLSRNSVPADETKWKQQDVDVGIKQEAHIPSTTEDMIRVKLEPLEQSMEISNSTPLPNPPKQGSDMIPTALTNDAIPLKTEENSGKTMKQERLPEEALDTLSNDQLLGMKQKQDEPPESIPPPPQILIASRTQKQLEQLIKELYKKTSLTPKMGILASRDHLCINPSAKDHPEGVNEGCR